MFKIHLPHDQAITGNFNIALFQQWQLTGAKSEKAGVIITDMVIKAIVAHWWEMSCTWVTVKTASPGHTSPEIWAGQNLNAGLEDGVCWRCSELQTFNLRSDSVDTSCW